MNFNVACFGCCCQHCFPLVCIVAHLPFSSSSAHVYIFTFSTRREFHPFLFLQQYLPSINLSGDNSYVLKNICLPERIHQFRRYTSRNTLKYFTSWSPITRSAILLTIGHMIVARAFSRNSPNWRVLLIRHIGCDVIISWV